MNRALNRTLATFIALIMLITGAVIFVAFLKSRKAAERRRPMSSMVPVVETVPLAVTNQPLFIECLGTVIADRRAAIQPEVGGRIVAVDQNLVAGERVKSGDLLVEIEDADYRIALQKAEADLLTAQSNLRLEEGQQDVVRHELKLMGSEESDPYRDLMLREPQLKAAQAAVKGAELAVQGAKLNLARTRITAPFDAVVVATEANIGDYAAPAKTLMELAATDRYFIRASVPLSALTPLPRIGEQPYQAQVTLSDGTTREARTYRLLPDLTEKGRMARLLLTVAAPYADGERRPLLLNEYVRVRIAGQTQSNVSLIPRRHLRDGNAVWMVGPERTLSILPAVLLQGYPDEVLVRIEPAPGMKLITTDLNAAIEGMALRCVGDPLPKTPGRKRPENGGPDDTAPKQRGA